MWIGIFRHSGRQKSRNGISINHSQYEHACHNRRCKHHLYRDKCWMPAALWMAWSSCSFNYHQQCVIAASFFRCCSKSLQDILITMKLVWKYFDFFLDFSHSLGIIKMWWFLILTALGRCLSFARVTSHLMPSDWPALSNGNLIYFNSLLFGRFVQCHVFFNTLEKIHSLIISFTLLCLDYSFPANWDITLQLWCDFIRTQVYLILNC